MKDSKLKNNNINKLIWTMGIPMIISMVLQAIYNVVDTIFVINSSAGEYGNLALTASFPIQILIISIGVGTGVGINALMTTNLGKGNKEMVDKIAGNGIFLAFIIYGVFLIFGMFFSKFYMRLMSNNTTVIEMGTTYLRICCILSLGTIGYTVYERFLQATGKTTFSMIAQLSGALSNIILDAIFILAFKWGVAGAAWATIIGQFISLIVACIFHYGFNKEVNNNIKYLKPSKNIIKLIYKIGLPAAIMQGLLAIMMFLVLQVLGLISNNSTRDLMLGSFGIYYKIMQIALFASFGLSNTLITITSFNIGLKDNARINCGIKYGIINSCIVMLVITLIFQVLASPLSNLFGMSILGDAKEEIIKTCKTAIHISSLGYIFMGISVVIQGILQGMNSIYKPIIISLLRLIILVIPLEILFIIVSKDNITTYFWIIFPISEFFTAIISIILLKNTKVKLKK